MDNKRPISEFAQRFVYRKLVDLSWQARECSVDYRDYLRTFSSSVDDLAARTKRGDLRECILSTAETIPTSFGHGRQGGAARDGEANDARRQCSPSSAPAEKYGAGKSHDRAHEIESPKRKR